MTYMAVAMLAQRVLAREIGRQPTSMDSIDHTDPAAKFDELTNIAGRALHREAGEAGGWFAKVLALRRAHL